MARVRRGLHSAILIALGLIGRAAGAEPPPPFAPLPPPALPLPPPTQPPPPPASPAPPRLVAPPPDSSGRVPFGALHWGKTPPGGVTVTADRPGVLVFLDGRFFGVAPVSISQVPAGDYIVEATYPDGRTVSRPVSVLEGTEQFVSLTPNVVRTPEPPPPAGAARARIRTRTWVVAGAGLAVLAASAVTGWLEIDKQEEYDKAPLGSAADRKHLDDLAQQGRTLALFTNVLVGAGAACLVAAGVMAAMDLRAGPAGEHPAAEPAVRVGIAAGPDLASWQATAAIRF